MTAKVHFFPLGNADTLRLDLADGRKVLVDYADMRNDDDPYDLRCDLPDELRFLRPFAVTGSARDSLGVFVVSVDDSGPAAKAGIQEGDRIASINGTDLRTRGSRDPDAEALRGTAEISRVERVISPATVHIGFKSDLDLPAFLAQAELNPVSIEKVNVPRIWSLVTCIKN